MYQLGSEILEEGLEVNGIALPGVGDLLEGVEDELILGIEAESPRGDEHVTNVGLAVSRIGIEGEHIVKFGDL